MNTFDLINAGGASNPVFPKKGRRAVVLCDGPPPSPPLLDYWLGGAELFICTDAAGHPYEHLPRSPDVVIGDFDSLTGRIISGRDGPRFLFVEDQETTDSEKALLYVMEEGATEVVMLGATGWRLDHTLFNCHLLERYADRLRICMSGYQTDVVRIDDRQPVSWHLAPGTGFSLLPLSGPATGVTIEGARFPLLNGTISPGGQATISNRVTFSPLLITIKQGSLLVTIDRGEWAGAIPDLED